MKRPFTHTLYLRMYGNLHAATVQAGLDQGFSTTTAFVVSLLQKALEGKIAPLASSSSSPAGAQVDWLKDLPPAPPKGGGRPEGVQDEGRGRVGTRKPDKEATEWAKNFVALNRKRMLELAADKKKKAGKPAKKLAKRSTRKAGGK
jgi:hypothetical protein